MFSKTFKTYSTRLVGNNKTLKMEGGENMKKHTIRHYMSVGFFMIAVIIGLSLLSVPAQALLIIDFGTGSAGYGGTITNTGTDIIGTGIVLDTLNISGAPLSNGSYDLQGTGDGSISGTDTNAVLNFGYGTTVNYINIVGAVSGLSITSTTLLSGTFSTFSDVNAGPAFSIYGEGPDIKADSLLIALGLTSPVAFDFFGFSIATLPTATPGVYVATSTDIVNQVPEPATLILFGSGLIGLGIFARKKIKA